MIPILLLNKVGEILIRSPNEFGYYCLASRWTSKSAIADLVAPIKPLTSNGAMLSN
jgi:hypothetical protein